MATHASISLPKPWPDFLREVDAGLSRILTLHCLGGFVLTALYGIPRYTGDLDYVEAERAQAQEESVPLALRRMMLLPSLIFVVAR